MTEKHFDVALPEEVVSAYDWQEGDVPARVRETLVMDLVRLGLISSGRAAELLDITRWEALDLMAKHKVTAIQLDPGEMEVEVSPWERRK